VRHHSNQLEVSAGTPVPRSDATPQREAGRWPDGRFELKSVRLGRRRYRFIKRSIDLACSVPLAILASPVIALCALMVAIDDHGSPFFRQQRVGRQGRAITVWKIRTMCHDAEGRLEVDQGLRQRYLEQGHKLQANEDPRILPVGRLLRKYSIDELPQLYQVVLGSLSLVGPRPVPRAELDRLYGVEFRSTYEAVRPGLTGLWQVSGRNHIVGPERALLDATYIETWTLLGDLQILIKTVPAVLSGHGAH
jgi:lipopolysaccharide/colanic/teichoic acid biosynthesis glycosyltransferase